MNEQIDEWADGWMDRWMNGQIDRQINVLMNGWIDELADGWMDTITFALVLFQLTLTTTKTPFNKEF